MKYSVKVCEAEHQIKISVTRGKERLAGSMLRRMAENLSLNNELFEFYQIRNEKEIDPDGEVVGKVALGHGILSMLTGKRGMVVLQKIHPCLTKPDFIQLTQDEIEQIMDNLLPGEDFVMEDHTVILPADYYMVATNDMDSIMRFINHIKPKDFEDFRKVMMTFVDVLIFVVDERDMYINYCDQEMADQLLKDTEKWLQPPEQVDMIQ